MSDTIYFSNDEVIELHEKSPSDAATLSEDQLFDVYQAVYVLAEMAGVEDDPQVIRLLDLIAYGATKNDADILPFNPKPTNIRWD